jgi:hypothetical protein
LQSLFYVYAFHINIDPIELIHHPLRSFLYLIQRNSQFNLSYHTKGGRATKAPTMAPTQTFVCDLCGNGQPLINLNTRVFIPGPSFLTCGAVAEASQNNEISVGDCPLLAQYLTPCGCPPPFNPDEIAPLPVPVDVNELFSAQLSAIEERIEAQTAELEMHFVDLEEKLDDWADFILDYLKSTTKSSKSISDGGKLNLKLTLTHCAK